MAVLRRILPLRYVLCVLACLSSAACGKPPPSHSTAELRSLLQPWTEIGAYAGFDSASGTLYLGNSLIERRFRLNADGNASRTSHYIHKTSGRNYVSTLSNEFKFRVGEVEFTANTDVLKYKTYEIRQGASEQKRLTIELEYSETSREPICSVNLHYEIYPNLPIVRKWITFENLTDSAFFVEDIIVESLSLPPASEPQSQAFEIRADMETDALPFFVVHRPDGDGGIIVGNEAPGILKHYNLSSGDAEIEAGLSPTAGINGIEVRVPPRAVASTPKVWTMLFEDDYSTASESLKRVVGQELKSSGEADTKTPPITWTKIPSDGKAPAGDFIVADYDWNGENLPTLRRMAKQIHEKGGKFGIRLPIAAIDVRFLNRSAWRLSPVANLGTLAGGNKTDATNVEKNVFCVLSDYGYYLSHAVQALLEETKAHLLVFDGALIGMPDHALKGCAALGHEHLSRKESISLIYQWLFEFADHLHRQHPDLQLGITSAAYGAEAPDMAVFGHFDLFFPKPDNVVGTRRVP